jgi:hypothetical protein
MAKFVYLANIDSNDISAYSIASHGALPVPGSPFAARVKPAFNKAGRCLRKGDDASADRHRLFVRDPFPTTNLRLIFRQIVSS